MKLFKQNVKKMYKVFKSKHHEGITAEKSYSYSTHYLLLSKTRSHICQVSCDQIEGSGSWIEEVPEPVYEEMTFSLTPDQTKKFEEWRKSKYNPADMKHYTFCFTPTGIGTCEVVKCSDGTKLELTDTSNW